DRRRARRRRRDAAGNAAADPRHVGRRRAMKPGPFDYVRPHTVEEGLALLAEYGDDARILAGGQSLVPMLNLRLVDASVLIDISRIGELDVIRNFSEAGDVEDIVEETRSAKVCGGLRVIENPQPHEKVEIG